MAPLNLNELVFTQQLISAGPLMNCSFLISATQHLDGPNYKLSNVVQNIIPVITATIITTCY